MKAPILSALLLGACAYQATPTPSPPPHCAGVVVTNPEQLQAALDAAAPGQTISVAPGNYSGNFTITRSGTQSAPIRMCGWGDPQLDGGSDGYTLYLDGAAWWSVEDISVTGGQIGIALDAAHDTTLSRLEVSHSGHEAVHLRSNSSRNRLTGLYVHDTGGTNPQYGEGVYVGSAVSNWCTYTACQPDRSDDNVIADSRFGPGITAEQIDVKEGTTGGLVSGNSFDGEGMSAADSWIDVKGNDWQIEANTGSSTPLDGMQVHDVEPGWGRGNTFTGNVLHVAADGYGIRIPYGDTTTTVACDNKVIGGAARSNVPCGSR